MNVSVCLVKIYCLLFFLHHVLLNCYVCLRNRTSIHHYFHFTVWIVSCHNLTLSPTVYYGKPAAVSEHSEHFWPMYDKLWLWYHCINSLPTQMTHSVYIQFTLTRTNCFRTQTTKHKHKLAKYSAISIENTLRRRRSLGSFPGCFTSARRAFMSGKHSICHWVYLPYADTKPSNHMQTLSWVYNIRLKSFIAHLSLRAQVKILYRGPPLHYSGWAENSSESLWWLNIGTNRI